MIYVIIDFSLKMKMRNQLKTSSFRRVKKWAPVHALLNKRLASSLAPNLFCLVFLFPLCIIFHDSFNFTFPFDILFREELPTKMVSLQKKKVSRCSLMCACKAHTIVMEENVTEKQALPPCKNKVGTWEVQEINSTSPWMILLHILRERCCELQTQ